MEMNYNGKNVKIAIGDQVYLFDDYDAELVESEMHGAYHKMTFTFTAIHPEGMAKVFNPTEAQRSMIKAHEAKIKEDSNG